GVASNGGLVLAAQPGQPGSDRLAGQVGHSGPAGRGGQGGPAGQAGLAEPPVIAGFRPSQDLAFSPLALTRDQGGRWRAGVLDAGLADVPDALAAAPGGGRLLALLTSGVVDQAGPGAAAWSPPTSMR